MATFNVMLREARERASLSETDAAAIVGASPMGYWDLEHHEDEWTFVIPAISLRPLIALLKIDWRSARIWREGGAEVPTDRLDAFLRASRERLGMSRDEFADKVGFLPAFVEAIEGNPDGLALWPLEVAFMVAEALSLREVSLAERLIMPQT